MPFLVPLVHPVHRRPQRGDVRAEVLVGFLGCHRWRSLTLAPVCRQPLNELSGCWLQRQCLDAELGRLLDDGR